MFITYSNRLLTPFLYFSFSKQNYFLFRKYHFNCATTLFDPFSSFEIMTRLRYRVNINPFLIYRSKTPLNSISSSHDHTGTRVRSWLCLGNIGCCCWLPHSSPLQKQVRKYFILYLYNTKYKFVKHRCTKYSIHTVYQSSIWSRYMSRYESQSG